MSKLFKISALIIFLVSLTAGTIYWNEAEKEVRILCGMFGEGQTADHVIKTLETGNLLTYSRNGENLWVTSPYTFNTESCEITFSENGLVSDVKSSRSMLSEIIIPWSTIILTFLLALFQFLLAIGVPLGEFAWGGFHRELPAKLRTGSAVSCLILILALLSVASAAQITGVIPKSIFTIVLPAFTILFFLSIIGNLNSVSKKEKVVMIPLSILLFSTYLFVSVKLM